MGLWDQKQYTTPESSIEQQNYHRVEITVKMNRGLTSHSLPKHKFHAPLVKRFPEDIQCIIQGRGCQSGSLFISNIEAAQSPSTLRKLNIKAVLSCAKGYELNHEKHIVNHYMYIPAIDHQTFDISIYFDRAVDFITKHIKNTNVLVHCIAGVSRSVSMVIAYFMREHNLEFEEAYRKVKSQRHIINPNSGFIGHLKNYRRELSQRSKPLQSSSPSSSRKIQTPTYFSPAKEDKKTAATATANDFYSKRGLPAAYPYEQKYSPPIYSTHRNELTPNPKHHNHTASLSKSMMKPTVKLFEEKYTGGTLQRTTTETNYQKRERQLNTYNSLNAELEEKIKKIREKYDAQRTVLQEKYQGSRKKSEYLVKQPQYEKLKTETIDLSDRKRYYQYGSNYKPQLDKLFPKKFYNDYHQELRRASPKKDLYNSSHNIYLQRQSQGLSNQRYRNNDSFKYIQYDVPNHYIHNRYGATGRAYH